ncbi:hypothetical protein FC84_GL001207 [Lapidilactobacillus dextrinicus DSM 20335]|uniref:Hydrogenase-4 component C n=1 Tax=Lapidilactobacillus dextrinicus DSM 20335 TaxID=1423738 RepID=A0A0R2BPJ7_9LACO|nr:DUF3737 family protein [Lapidilactobacillus dextrinicus]KRM78185.1 hypothetical protein FC84_GL001207 [Lapidilactobacillus dextrinicus DSM 20335]QFG47145.1 DUF3737 family protein [Lapidilactobacillus dextrinicus]
MTKEIKQQYFSGERALFGANDVAIKHAVFLDGESPLKESENVSIDESTFTYKYPVWNSINTVMTNSKVELEARAGFWYDNGLTIKDSVIMAPKEIRNSQNVTLENVYFSDGEETLWNCEDVTIKNVQVKGDYFCQHSKNVYVDHLTLDGKYAFDSCENVEVHNSRMMFKDTFWNCKNVTIYDSFLSGKYLSWHAENITFINCTIETEQGLCYLDHLTMKNCTMMNSDRVFEFCSNVDIDINSHIESVKNIMSGTVRAQSIGKLVMDPTKVDVSQTKIICLEIGEYTDHTEDDDSKVVEHYINS